MDLRTLGDSALTEPLQERERAELQDRVDDLDNVQEAVRDELLDSACRRASLLPSELTLRFPGQVEIDRRREALVARRHRLRRVKELDEENSVNLREQATALDDTASV